MHTTRCAELRAEWPEEYEHLCRWPFPAPAPSSFSFLPRGCVFTGDQAKAEKVDGVLLELLSSPQTHS